MNSLFGIELPTTVAAIIAFVIVIALIGVVAWLVRRFGVARLGAARGRQPRLAVIDAAAVDGRRKLIIIRRDNVEHLLMIGGPSDVVVETNIMRAAAATQREATPARVDTLPRAVPLPESNWPLPPEPTLAPRADRPRTLPEEPAPIPAPLPPPIPAPIPLRADLQARPPSATDPLVGLAAELSRVRQEMPQRAPEPPRIPLTANYPTAEAPIVPVVSNPPAPPVAPATPISADAHLAEMAQRLESALRRPLAPLAPGSRPGAEPKRLEPKAFPYPESTHSTANGPTNGTTNGPTNGMQQGNGAPARSIYEDLEQEMASLLGRQPGKS